MLLLFDDPTGGMPETAWITAIFGLAGTIVGGLISLASTLLAEHIRTKRALTETKHQYEALAKSIASEIDTGLRMFRFRKVREAIFHLLQEAQKGNLHVFHMQIGEHNLAVTRSSLTKIGYLAGDIPPLISELVTLVNSIKLDLDRFDAMPKWEGSQQDLVMLYQQLLVIIDRAFEVGQELVTEIAKQYPGYQPAPWNRSTDTQPPS